MKKKSSVLSPSPRQQFRYHCRLRQPPFYHSSPSAVKSRHDGLWLSGDHRAHGGSGPSHRNTWLCLQFGHTATGAPVSVPLLTTKLYIPQPRPDLVPRPRLTERLNEGMRRKLTLISAPAGFGKTTLLSEWVHRRGAVTAPLQVAWLSLDEADNDPARFLAYFIAALQTVEENIGEGTLGAFQSPL